MRFVILGHVTDLSLDHVLLVALSMVVILGIVWAGGSALVAIPSQSIGIPFTPIFLALITIFGLPVLAYFLLLMAKWTKRTLDERLCRSLSLSLFLLLAFVYIVITIQTINTSSQDYLYNVPYYVSTYALAAFILYLWMLAFIRRDLIRAKTVFPLAVAYGFVMFMINQLFGFVSAYYAEVVFLPDLSFSAFVTALKCVVLGFAVLYTAYLRKVDGVAYLFVVLMTFPSILGLIFGVPGSTTLLSGYFVSFLSALLSVMVLFVLAKMRTE